MFLECLFQSLPQSIPGAAFEQPINTSARGEAPTYRVAPYIGESMARPGNGKAAVFYDMDNQRFMGRKQGYVDFLMQVLNPIRDKEGDLNFLICFMPWEIRCTCIIWEQIRPIR